MNLYNKDGWIDIPSIRAACPDAFLFVLVGARQIGKTYGIIDYFHSTNEPYIYMRGTGEELKYSLSTRANLYTEKGFPWAGDMSIATGRPCYAYDTAYQDGAEPVCLALALSDVAKIRGFGGKKYRRIFYDEFIPERSAFNRKGMGEALKNAYVTINSNRELFGEPPCELWLAANSNNLDNDILRSFNLTGKLINMQRRKQHFSYLPEKGVCIILFDNSPISAALSNTALFRCIGTDSEFARMALSNVFINDDDAGVTSKPLAEYLPKCRIDNLTFYGHKSRREYYIVEDGEMASPVFVSDNPTSLAAFRLWWNYYGLPVPEDGKNLYYNTYTAKLAAYKILNIKDPA